MYGEALIRFVGGPWHNRHVATRLLPVLTIPHAPTAPIDPRDWLKMKFEPSVVLLHEYHLWQFVSNRGCCFMQYIHTSMFRGSLPASLAFEEAELPAMPPVAFRRFQHALRLRASA